MRGNPLIRLVVAVVVFLLLGVPVWRLTEGEEAKRFAEESALTAQKDQGTARVLDFLISYEYETKPQSVVFMASDDEGKQQSLEISMTSKLAFKEWKLSIPETAKQLDVTVTASWSDTKRHALRITTFGPNLPQTERTVWLNADNPSDTFTFTIPPQN